MTTPGPTDAAFDSSGNLILVVVISLLLATGIVILVIAEAQDELAHTPTPVDSVGDPASLDLGSDSPEAEAHATNPLGAPPANSPVGELEAPDSGRPAPVSRPTSNRSAPDGDVGRTPSGTAPSGTTPSGTTPSGTAPSGTTPSGTTPSGTADAPGQSPPQSAETSAAPEPAPSGPTAVQIREADQVNILRALGGNKVVFMPTRVFDPLRDAHRDPSYQIVVEVRSKVVKESGRVAIHATGLWVRITDTVRHVRLPTIKVEFTDGPYPRRVNRDEPSRPQVEPFNTALRLNAKPYVKRVEAAIREALAASTAKRKPR